MIATSYPNCAQIGKAYEVGVELARPIHSAMESTTKRLYVVQFHPEVTHTKTGFELLREFAHAICGCDGSRTAANTKENAIARLREQVGTDKNERASQIENSLEEVLERLINLEGEYFTQLDLKYEAI